MYKHIIIHIHVDNLYFFFFLFDFTMCFIYIVLLYFLFLNDFIKYPKSFFLNNVETDHMYTNILSELQIFSIGLILKE